MPAIQVHEDIQTCGSALINACGLKPGEESFVGLYANNCPQWTVVDLACAGYNLVSATMWVLGVGAVLVDANSRSNRYPTFDDEAISYIVKLCGIPVVFVQRGNVPRLFKIGPNLPSLSHVIIIDDAVNGGDRQQAGQLGWNIMDWDEFMSKGTPRVPLCPPKDPKALYSLCFTVG